MSPFASVENFHESTSVAVALIASLLGKAALVFGKAFFLGVEVSEDSCVRSIGATLLFGWLCGPGAAFRRETNVDGHGNSSESDPLASGE